MVVWEVEMRPSMPGGGHGCDVGGLVFVFGGYEDEDAAPVEDCW